MKKNLKFLVLFVGLILLAGCFRSMTPSEKVEDMLNRYIKNDKDIVTELDTYLKEQNLTDEQRERYKNIILDEYATIKYTIKDEKIDGNTATVEASITVKDLYKANKKAGDYLVEHAKEFYTNDIYDESKFIDYKLTTMEDFDETVSYTIYVELKKDDDIWVIQDLDNDTLEKIHGIYDYETNENS